LAAAVPLLLYLSTLGGSGYWLDAGEFVAASTLLDIAHPPGHPLSLLYGKAVGWLPFASLPFRLSLGQAFAGAVAASFAAHACALTARRVGIDDARVIGPIAVFGAWLAVLSYGVWFQAVRPEVYALQLALLCAALAALCRVEGACAEPAMARGALVPLLIACLCIGLRASRYGTRLPSPGATSQVSKPWCTRKRRARYA
jgi:hypothetical protein